MKLDIVTHVYSPPGMDQYAKHLEFQAHSLMDVVSPNDCVNLFVCSYEGDVETNLALSRIHGRTAPAHGVSVWRINQEPDKLFRRAIGRNYIAKKTEADVVWFADADYFVGEDFMSQLQAADFSASAIYYPKAYQINVDWETGDRLTQSTGGINVDDFKLERPSRAIGGQFFVSSEQARKGYLDDTKWQRPIDPTKGFGKYHCDVAYKKEVGLLKKFELSSLFRIRHTDNGRDINLDGERR